MSGYGRSESGPSTGEAVAGCGCAILLVIAVIAGAFALGWLNGLLHIGSFENVSAQWQFAYDYDEKLQAIARQDCTAKAAEAAETDPNLKSQRTSQRIAIENNYDRVASEYNARLRDAFRAKLVRPPDVPDHAPTLGDALRKIGCAT